MVIAFTKKQVHLRLLFFNTICWRKLFAMVFDYFDKFTFICEMYDEQVDEIRKLILNFFPFDNSIQLIDTEKEKILLRRVQLPTLTLNMLQMGNVINIFSKLFQITDCAPATKNSLFKNVESTFAMIKPVPAQEHGKILTYIMKKGFRIVQLKNGMISKDFAIELYKHLSGNSIMPMIVEYVTSGEVIGLELVANNAVKNWRKCLGTTDPKTAEPDTLRYLFGQNILKNVAHGCDSLEISREIIDLFFGSTNGLPNIPRKATFKDCTCCVIKPHAIIEENLGAILERISTTGTFYVSAMSMFYVKLANAEDFYEIYKGVVPEYEAMAIHLAEGKCAAVEVKNSDPSINVVCEFRKLCGPRDPDVGRQLYPNSMRAQYGKDIVHNAVHCTDLPEDGETEVEYFFKLIANDC